jgi:hypothetical protein
MLEPQRTIHCEDALGWLTRQAPLDGASIITSLPDYSEFPKLSLEEWKDWFTRAAALTLSRCPDDGVTIFYQTDIKKNGAWIDKGYLCQKAAEQEGHALLWHKFVCRAPLGNISFGRPGYSHLLCFSRGVRADVAASTTDTLPEAGEVTWTRGMGLKACLAACQFVLKQTATRTIVDPFCGHGTVLAVANSLGLDAVGVELSAKRAKIARTLTVADVRGDQPPNAQSTALTE